MRERTFVRTMLDAIFNNPIVRTVDSLVNFCYELSSNNKKLLKFSNKMTINNNTNKYSKKLIFNNVAKRINQK